jgi:hypothetical protein
MLISGSSITLVIANEAAFVSVLLEKKKKLKNIFKK